MKKNIKKIKLSHVFLSVSLISTLTFGVLYIDTNNKLDENVESLAKKSEYLNTLEKENGVLMSREIAPLNESDLSINNIKEILNNTYLSYNIKYNNDEYYLWVEDITKKSIDVTKNNNYDLSIKYKILKDKKVDKLSYVKDLLDKEINELIAHENELLKKSLNKDENIKTAVINNDRIDELYSIITNDITVSKGEENISFTVNSSNSLDLHNVLKVFVKNIILKNNGVDLKVTEKDGNVSIVAGDKVFVYNKDSKTLK